MGGICCSVEHKHTKIISGKTLRQSEISQDTKLESKLYKDIVMSYEFVKVCGYGQFGTVREAKKIFGPQDSPGDTAKGLSFKDKSYAVKSIIKSRVKTNFAMLKKEIAALKRADHPNIVRLYEIYEDAKYLHLVMDLCKGPDLQEYCLLNGPLSEKQTSILMKKLLGAINHLHSLDICHRDIKPENIMYSQEFNTTDIKLVDFGMSAKFQEDELKTAVGTPYYIAPEVTTGRYGKECDIWSLGVCMFYFLSCSHPFTGTTVNRLLRNIARGEFKFQSKTIDWEYISPEAKDLISKMLVTRPYRRITIPRALLHPWFSRMESSEDIPININMVKNLAKTKATTKIRKEILKVLVRNLNEAEIYGLNDIFDFFDQNKTGFISSANIIHALQLRNFSLASEEVRSNHYIGITENFEHSNGRIKYTEFIGMVIDTKRLVEAENVWNAFKHFDHDNDNLISVNDFRWALEKAGAYITEEELEELVEEFQLHVRDYMDFDQFKAILTCNPQLGFSEEPSPNFSGSSNISASVKKLSNEKLSRLRSILSQDSNKALTSRVNSIRRESSGVQTPNNHGSFARSFRMSHLSGASMFTDSNSRNTSQKSFQVIAEAQANIHSATVNDLDAINRRRGRNNSMNPISPFNARQSQRRLSEALENLTSILSSFAQEDPRVSSNDMSTPNYQSGTHTYKSQVSGSDSSHVVAIS